MKKIRWLLPLLVLITGCRSAEPEIPAVSGFEVEKYLGKWYEIARSPNWFEKGMTEVYAEYSKLPDGSLQVVNRGVKNGQNKSITGKLRAAGAGGQGELEVAFFRPFYSAYRIIKLAPDYRYSVVVGSMKDYFWILAREPQLSPEDLIEINSFLEKHDFPVDKLIFSQKK